MSNIKELRMVIGLLVTKKISTDSRKRGVIILHGCVGQRSIYDISQDAMDKERD